MIEIVLMVCKLTQPDVCEEQHLRMAWQGSLTRCTIEAQPFVAQWVGDHPQWTVKSFRCDYPRDNDRAQTDGPAK
jgi:hypothetical protein